MAPSINASEVDHAAVDETQGVTTALPHRPKPCNASDGAAATTSDPADNNDGNNDVANEPAEENEPGQEPEVKKKKKKSKGRKGGKRKVRVRCIYLHYLYFTLNFLLEEDNWIRGELRGCTDYPGGIRRREGVVR